MAEIGTVRKESAGRWVADLKPPGGRRVRRVCRTKTAALSALAQLRADHVAPGDGGLLVREVLDNYAAELAVRARPRSERAARQGAAILGTHLGAIPATALTSRDLDRFIAAERKRGLKPTSINSRLRLLKSALRSAVDAGELPTLPCRIKLLREARRMPSTLTPAEIKKLLNAASDDRIRAVIEVALMTGLRRSELVYLQWGDWRPGKGIRVEAKPELNHEVKDHQDRLVPTNPQLDTILQSHRGRLQHSRPADFIFQRHEGRGSRWDANVLGQAIRDALKTAGLWRVGRGLHEFRRTATSKMLEAGVDARTVQHVLGHSTIMLLERYGAVSAPQMQRAGNALCLSETGKRRPG